MDSKDILAFLETYYKSFSDNRQQLLALYTQESIVTWEKQAYCGVEQIKQNLERMGAANLRYSNLNEDFQMIAPDMILIHVSGMFL